MTKNPYHILTGILTVVISFDGAKYLKLCFSKVQKKDVDLTELFYHRHDGDKLCHHLLFYVPC